MTMSPTYQALERLFHLCPGDGDGAFEWAKTAPELTEPERTLILAATYDEIVAFISAHGAQLDQEAARAREEDDAYSAALAAMRPWVPSEPGTFTVLAILKRIHDADPAEYERVLDLMTKAKMFEVQP